jgi:adenylate cyclase, class 2
MKTEIEIKIQIIEDQGKHLVEWLDKNSTNKKIVYQVEHYLNNPLTSFIFTSQEGYRDSKDFLRIRFSSGKDSLCLKQWHSSDNNSSLTHCDEYETEVQNGEEVLRLFRALGYTEEVIIKKTRVSYTTLNFDISIDEVENLGHFMEIELIAEVETVQLGLSLIYDFLKKRGLYRFRKMERGYVSMMWNPERDFGEEINLG